MSSTVIGGQQSSYGIKNGLAPSDQPLTMPVVLGFSVSITEIDVDLATAQEKNNIDLIQTLYIDNSNSGSNLSVQSSISGQVMNVPAGMQAYLPVIVPNAPKFVFKSAGGANVNVQFLNVCLPALVWGSTSSGSNSIDHSFNAPAVITLIGSVAANAMRNEIYVQNQSNDQIQVKLEGGTIILLQSGGANSQGASWSSTSYKGSLIIYGGSSGDQVAVYET